MTGVHQAEPGRPRIGSGTEGPRTSLPRTALPINRLSGERRVQRPTLVSGSGPQRIAKPIGTSAAIGTRATRGSRSRVLRQAARRNSIFGSHRRNQPATVGVLPASALVLALPAAFQPASWMAAWLKASVSCLGRPHPMPTDTQPIPARNVAAGIATPACRRLVRRNKRSCSRRGTRF
jgi:hypothetical protein